MIIFRRGFEPPLWSWLLSLSGVLLFVCLGLWQLERAEFKESIKLKYQQRLAQDYRLFDLDTPMLDLEFRKLSVDGRYLAGHDFLVDNQIYQGNPGFHVLSALQLDNSDRILLVNRGWVALGDSRQRLPLIQAPPGGRVRGIASFISDQGFRLGAVDLDQGWPKVIPFVDMAALRRQYSERLLPMVLWLAPEQPGHYLRDWNPHWADPDKSRAYATQWFGFALIAGVLFVVLNLRKIE